MATNPKIKQRDLADYRERKNRIESLEKSLRAMKEEQSREEEILLDAVRRRTPFERGSLAVGINQTKRRSPKWKEEYAMALGADAVETVLDSTPETVYEKVVIIETRGGKG